MIYLDHAATTPVYPEALEAMTPYLDTYYFNPSGNYREGISIRKTLNRIRLEIAESIHADPKEIVFTSGGTESDNWALINAARQYSAKGHHIITSSIEHHAILHTCHFLESRGFDITFLPVTSKGIIDPE